MLDLLTEARRFEKGTHRVESFVGKVVDHYQKMLDLQYPSYMQNLQTLKRTGSSRLLTLSALSLKSLARLSPYAAKNLPSPPFACAAGLDLHLTRDCLKHGYTLSADLWRRVISPGRLTRRFPPWEGCCPLTVLTLCLVYVSLRATSSRHIACPWQSSLYRTFFTTE